MEDHCQPFQQTILFARIWIWFYEQNNSLLKKKVWWRGHFHLWQEEINYIHESIDTEKDGFWEILFLFELLGPIGRFCVRSDQSENTALVPRDHQSNPLIL